MWLRPAHADRDLPDGLVLPLAIRRAVVVLVRRPARRSTSSTPAASAGAATSRRSSRPTTSRRGWCSAGVMDAPATVAARRARARRATCARRSTPASRPRSPARPAPAAAVTLVDDWLVFAGARPAARRSAPAARRCSPSAPPPTRRAARWAWSRWTPRRCWAARAARRASASARRRPAAARFYDRSPAGRRRWCSMRTCGNEAKVRRHRERQKSTDIFNS